MISTMGPFSFLTCVCVERRRRESKANYMKNDKLLAVISRPCPHVTRLPPRSLLITSSSFFPFLPPVWDYAPLSASMVLHTATAVHILYVLCAVHTNTHTHTHTHTYTIMLECMKECLVRVSDRLACLKAVSVTIGERGRRKKEEEKTKTTENKRQVVAR